MEGDFVAAVYENRWYIGRVVELDNLECEISFMAKSKNLFKWLNSPDEVWIRIDAILCKISEPMATGRSQRMFRIQAKYSLRFLKPNLLISIAIYIEILQPSSISYSSIFIYH